MKILLRALVLSSFFGGTVSVMLGHGIPIDVDVDSNNKLVVSNPQPLYNPIDLTSGYAPMVLVDNEDVAEMSQITLSNSNPLGLQGTYQFTTLPGFNISNMAPGSDLELQVIPRPVAGTNPVQTRMLWHWSLAASLSPSHPNAVTLDPNNESLTIASDPDGVVQSIQIPQTGNSSPTIKVADPQASDLGTHQHFLEYFLQDSPPADAGMYGVFARLTSPNYAPSDPFLMLFDDNMNEDDYPGQILAAALAINNAALLAGDYNHDDRVNSQDYVLGRKTVGSTQTYATDGTGDHVIDQADFGVWRSNYGLTAGGSGLSVARVPEPASCWLLMSAVILSFAGAAPRKRHR